MLRLVSGGQTGVDRAALDVALDLGLPCGGWCPKGRVAEDGVLADRYPLRETPSPIYPERTEWNVRDSDGTLVLVKGEPSGGTALTLEVARRLAKPSLLIDLSNPPSPDAVRAWLTAHGIRTLNVAGPRESTCPGIYADAVAFLRSLLT
ncbi:putative molybdenum carrier protein [Candidatus Nitrospira bockiana]